MKARIFAEENKKWWTLAAVSFGLFMIMLDNTIVNVALPTIQSSLHLKVSEGLWLRFVDLDTPAFLQRQLLREIDGEEPRAAVTVDKETRSGRLDALGADQRAKTASG